MALALGRALLRTAWEILKFLATFTGDLGTQLLILMSIAIALPPILDFLEKYGVRLFVWVLDKFR